MKRFGIGIAAGLGIAVATAQAMPIDRIVTVQPIRICDDVGANCAAAVINEPLIDKIYAQAGIDIAFLPMRQFNSSSFLTTTVESIAPTRIDEWRRLTRGAATAAVRSANPATLNVFFVNNIVDAGGGGGIRGVGFINGNGAIISGSAAVIDTLAHELAHNLGLDHGTYGNAAQPANNLLTDGGGRQVPGGVNDVFPTGNLLSQLNALQVDRLRQPLFSVKTNVARAQLQDFALGAGVLRRIGVGVNGANQTEALKRLKVWWPAGTTFGYLNMDVSTLIAGGCPAPCVSSTTSTLADGTIEMVFEFPNGAFLPLDAVALDVTSPAVNGIFPKPPTPFSFVFEFDSGFASQAALDANGTASSDAPDAVRTWLGEPNYGPPASAFPEPDGIAVHFISEGTPAIPAPASAALLAGALGALLLGRRRVRR